MPPKKNEEKFTEMLDEALQPKKEVMENLITREVMAILISGLEDELVKAMSHYSVWAQHMRAYEHFCSYADIR